MLLRAIENGNAWALLYMLPILVLTLMVHELCHGWMSWGLGGNTARDEGRISFNPLKHIDPVGFLALLVLGFGWAKPVRVDMRNLRKPKRDFALVALAGPLSNFILAYLCFLAYLTLDSFFSPPALALDALWYAVSINIGLGVFNLIPVPPLDGSRLVAAFLPDRLYFKFLRLEQYSRFILLGVILLISRTSVIDGFYDAVFGGLYNLCALDIGRWLTMFTWIGMG